MSEQTQELSIHENDHELYESFELADEQQIIAEISGRVTDKYVYELKGVKDASGNPVNGLSYAGTNWACREYAKQGEVIRIVAKEFNIDPTDQQYIIVCVTAQRFSVNPETGKEIALDSTIGIKRQWRMMKKNKYQDGQKVGEEIVEDPFFWEKGTSKAIRNAKQGLIPVDIVKQLIAQALKQKNGQDVGARSGGAPRQQQRTQKANSAPAQGPAAPATTPPPSSSAPAGPTPPQGSPPAQGSQSQGAPPQQGSSPPQGSPPQGSGKQKPPRDVVNQKFEAVLKAAVNTQDGEKARAALAKLTGFSKISDLPDETLKNFGNLLQGVIKKANKVDGHKILTADGNTVLWTGPAPAAAPAAEAPPEPEQPGDFTPF